MKKAYLLIVLLTVFAASAFAVEVTHTGRIIMEMVMENNWTDWTSWDENDAPNANDKDAYGKARVDLGFNMKFSENVVAKIAFRGEGNDTNNKWMYWGKNNVNPGEQLSDAEMTLQEAYITFKDLFHMPLMWNVGRMTYKYSANAIYDRDKLDGWRLSYMGDAFSVAAHYFIIERNGQLVGDEKCDNKTLLGLHGDYKNDMMKLQAGFWMLSVPYDKDDNDSDMLIGARGEFTLMNGMIMPFAELQIQSGSEWTGVDTTKAETDHSGMLIDLGSKFKMDMGSGEFDACIEFLQSSGDDVDTEEDENYDGKSFLANNEQGFMLVQVADGGVQMIKVGAGFTPAAMEKLRVGINFWMFNDATANMSYQSEGLDTPLDDTDDVFTDYNSGENMWNEIEVNATWDWMKNVKLYGMFNFGMPNKDYFTGFNMNSDNSGLEGISQGEDSAFGLTFGAQVKW